MKKQNLFWGVLALMMAMTLSVSFTSCGGDDGGDDKGSSGGGGGGSTSAFAVSPSELTLSSNSGASGSFSITTTGDWVATCGESWVSLSKNQGSGTASITVTANSENTATTERSATITVNSSGATKYVLVKQSAPSVVSVSVSPTSVSLLAKEGSTTSIQITSTGAWSISNSPEWLHLTALSGQGNTSVTLTAKSDNFSDVERTATLTVSTSTSSTTLTVSQEPVLAKNLQVKMTDLTVMSDGFASYLTFPANAKGYREAFFTEYAVQTKTERDIFNMLMEKTEYSGSLDLTYSPIVDPGTVIYYCIAAYGNENNSDGTHKYGAMTIEKIVVPEKTLYADMYVTSTYTSARWTATTQKYGTYGTRCQKYYYFAYEGDDAETANLYYNGYPYAVLALLEYKPKIKDSPDDYAVSGQSFFYPRSENKFFFGVWGIDDTGKYSAEHTSTYQNLSSAPALMMQTPKRAADVSKWNEPRKILSKAELRKVFSSAKKVSVIK